MKQQSFNYGHIAICTDCHGTGMIDESTILRKIRVKCATCDGTGRVWKVKQGTVSVEPYHGQDLQK